MATLTYTQELVTTECWCGVVHAIPASLDKQAREHKKGVYCPLGHSWVYSQSVEEKLAAERARHDQTKAEVARQRRLREAEERSHAATRGHLTRQRKRAKAGVCPCCNRTFQQLARHMKSQHPDFDPAAANSHSRGDE